MLFVLPKKNTLDFSYTIGPRNCCDMKINSYTSIEISFKFSKI